MLHKKIEVFGKVQQVGFRYYTQKKAKELGINGFVKNLSDGSVYIEAEAEEVQIDHFILWCNSGPRLARVKRIKVQGSKTIGFDKFEIK